MYYVIPEVKFSGWSPGVNSKKVKFFYCLVNGLYCFTAEITRYELNSGSGEQPLAKDPEESRYLIKLCCCCVYAKKRGLKRLIN